MAYEVNYCNTKQDFEHIAEVTTGKKGGSPTGADIDVSTLKYTGQVRETLPSLLRKIGYYSVGEWGTNPTLTNINQYVYYAATTAEYQPTSLPYIVDSASHPDPEALVTSGELKRLVRNEIPYNDIARVSGADVHIVELGIEHGSTTDSRDIIYNAGVKVYVPKGFTFRCNLLPTDDVTVFKGEGLFTTTDPFGNTHTFDISLSDSKSKFTPSQLINQSLKTGGALMIGIGGDSISDGADSTGWVSNPIDSSENLNSTDYNHDQVGAVNGWVNKFRSEINRYVLPRNDAIKTANISKSGKKLFDGWLYRNFDYGFFKNLAYNNKAPNVFYISMGVNDNNSLISLDNFEEYLDEYEKVIRKAWGYGCAVGAITVSNMTLALNTLEKGLKARLGEAFENFEFVDVTTEMYETMQCQILPTQADFFGSGSSLDMTHPKDLGHSTMAMSMVRRVIPDMVMDREINSPIRSSNCLIKTVNDAILVPTLVNAKSYLSKYVAYAGVSNPTGDNFNCYYTVYCEAPENTLTLVFPYISSTSTVSVNVRSGTRLGNGDYITHSVGVSANKQNVVMLTGVKAGFNSINIAVESPGTTFDLPVVMISNTCLYDSAKTAQLVVNDGQVRSPIYNADSLFSSPEKSVSPIRLPPTSNNVGGFAITTGARIYSRGDKSVAFSYDPHDESGFVLMIKSGTATIHRLSGNSIGALLDTLNGDFSGNVELTVVTTPTGVTATLINSDGTVRDASASPLVNSRNGLIYHANFTGAPITQWMELTTVVM